MKWLIKNPSERLSRFIEDQSGTATILSLYFVLIAIVVGGLAIDFNKAISDRTQLQVAADSAAHAALYSRESMSESEAKQAAFSLIEPILDNNIYADAISVSDITFGAWDFDSDSFVAISGSKSAVRVRSEMTFSRDNASQNLLLRIVGHDQFEILTDSIYATYLPPCFTEGFVAEDVVDIQSNNAFTDGFCIHSNAYVSLNSNNSFEAGTVVSMPDLADLDIPKSGFTTNAGLGAALRTGEHNLRILNKLPDIVVGLRQADSEYIPDYITSGIIETLNGNSLEPSDFVSGRVHTMSCSGSGKVTMNEGTYKDIVFVSDCEVKFANGVILEDATVATTNRSLRSLNSPSGLQLGRNDNCGFGGGAVLMTLGGFNAAAGLQVYGGQILAMENIEFAAQANGVEGASFISYDRIDSTSNMDFGYCSGDGMEDAWKADYFRMVD